MQSTKHSTGLVSRLLAFTVLISAANSAWAAERVPCATSRKVVAACYMVHGRLSLGNGNPAMRMWKIGTTRMLGIYDGNFKEQEGGPLFELLLPRRRSYWIQGICGANLSMVGFL
jgi:hypothetical protein